MTSALLLAQQGVSSTAETVLFVLFAGIAIGAGIAMVAMRNVVHGALMLVANLLSLAGLYLVLQSTFLSIIQVIVYAGAIMVLFLFVIMLLGIDRDDLLVEVHVGHRLLAVIAALAVVGFLAWGMIGPYTSDASLCGTAEPVRTSQVQGCAGMDDVLAASDAGSVELISHALFTRWTFPFEAAALLLIVATIGAMLLGRRHQGPPGDDPAWATSHGVPDLPPEPDGAPDSDGSDPESSEAAHADADLADADHADADSTDADAAVAAGRDA